MKMPRRHFSFPVPAQNLHHHHRIVRNSSSKQQQSHCESRRHKTKERNVIYSISQSIELKTPWVKCSKTSENSHTQFLFFFFLFAFLYVRNVKRNLRMRIICPRQHKRTSLLFLLENFHYVVSFTHSLTLDRKFFED